MKISFNIIIMCCLLLLSSSLVAQKTYTEKSDPEARKILKKLGDTYRFDDGVYIKYKLVLDYGEDKEIQEGEIYQKGSKYYIHDNGNLIINDGSTISVYNKKQNEVQLSDYDPDDGELISPTKILSIYKADKEFFYAITGEDASGYKIEFKPLDKDSEIMKIRIEVDKSKTKLKSVKVFSDDGGRYTFTINEIKANKVSDSKFKFDKSAYPGVKVVDLRD